MNSTNVLFIFAIGFFVGFSLAGLLFLGDDGKVRKVRTTADWKKKQAEIRRRRHRTGDVPDDVEPL
jgi:hypothetical protein